MNTLDIILSIFLLLGFVRGFFKGFLLELSGLVALIAGVFGAMHFSETTYAFLSGFISWEEQYLSLLAFALTFIGIVIIISIIGKLLTKMVNLIALGILNRLLGSVFGLVKVAFLASLVFMFLNQSPAFALGEQTKQESVLYEPVEALAPMLLPTLLKEINERDLLAPDGEEEEQSLSGLSLHKDEGVKGFCALQTS